METSGTSGLRIGIPIIGNKDWLGGVHYVKSIVEAVSLLPRSERPRMFLLVDDHTLAASDLHRDLFALLDGVLFFGQNVLRARAMLPSPVIYCRTPEEFSTALDFFYPVVGDVIPDLCSGSWIYDFQHVHLPEFFSQDEIHARNTKFRRIAETAKLVVFSSRNAEEDFWRIFPESKAVTKVLSFHSLPSENWLKPDPSETQRKYSLPDDFLICCNQFWIHKNHRRLFEAMAQVVRSAPDTHLVCTGSTSDWRFPGYFSEIAAFIKEQGLKNQVRILGTIPRIDQLQLMRRSLAVIQPSLFEGWSSVVEESRMLGKTIILSDLQVHQEQAPDHAVYFDRYGAGDLAEKMLAVLPDLSPGPDRLREQEARKKSVELVENFGRTFYGIAEEAQRLFGKQNYRKSDAPSVKPATAGVKENSARLSSGGREYPKISIVTPSFNQGQFLEECIDSILSQNYPNLEYIVMDGGSTDNSIEIIKKYEKYLNFWKSGPDAGQYFAINLGFEKTTGEIMTWLNSDDILLPKSLDTVSEIFSRFGEIEWIMGRPNGIDEHGKGTWVLDPLPLWSREKYLRRQYRNPYIQQEGTFWKRSLWKRAGGAVDTSWKLAGDLELWARFFRYSQLYSVDALLGAFRQHPAQKTAALFREYNLEAERIIDREIRLYDQGVDKTLLPAPAPVALEQLCTSKDQADTGPALSSADKEPAVKLSAIVSTYNSERFMRGCLEDLVGQTLYQKGGLEIIVVDSGSEQNERAIVEEFRKKYGNIAYLHTEGRESVYAAWNRGISVSSGKYITNANTDDRHRKDALEVMCDVLANNPDIGLVYADVIITETENETFDKHTVAGYFRWLDYNREKLATCCFIGPQPMWRRSLHDEYGFFDETFSSSGDWDFWLRIAAGTRLLHIHEFLGLYLRSSESLEHRNSLQKMEEDRLIYKTYIPLYLPSYDQYFAKLLGTDLADKDNVYRYGQILAALNRYDDAISLYTAYLQRFPRERGFALLLEYLKKLKILHAPVQPKPLSSLPEEVVSYINRADAHMAQGDLAGAREDIRQALQHAAGHDQLCMMLSNMLARLESS